MFGCGTFSLGTEMDDFEKNPGARPIKKERAQKKLPWIFLKIAHFRTREN